jgi:hypothetical protein
MHSDIFIPEHHQVTQRLFGSVSVWLQVFVLVSTILFGFKQSKRKRLNKEECMGKMCTVSFYVRLSVFG